MTIYMDEIVYIHCHQQRKFSFACQAFWGYLFIQQSTYLDFNTKQWRVDLFLKKWDTVWTKYGIWVHQNSVIINLEKVLSFACMFVLPSVPEMEMKWLKYFHFPCFHGAYFSFKTGFCWKEVFLIGSASSSSSNFCSWSFRPWTAASWCLWSLIFIIAPLLYCMYPLLSTTVTSCCQWDQISFQDF